MKKKPMTHQRTKIDLDVVTLDLKVFVVTSILGVFCVGMGFIAAMASLDKIGTAEVKSAVSSCPVYTVSDLTGGESESNRVAALRLYSSPTCSRQLSQLQGKLNILIFDNFDDGISYEQYFLETSQGDVELYFAHNPHAALLAGSELEVSGYYFKDSKSLLFDAAQELTNEQSAPDSGYKQLSGGERGTVEGTKYILTALTYFQGESQPIKPPILDVQDSMYLTDMYYQENSFGLVDLAGKMDTDQQADVRGWYEIDLPRPTCEQIYPGGMSTDVYESAIRALDSAIDMTQYDGESLMIVTNFNCTSKWYGLGWLSPRTVTLANGQDIEISVTMLDNSKFPVGGYYNHPPTLSEINNGRRDAKDDIVLVIGHELGHNFGHRHAAAHDSNIFEVPVHLCNISLEDEYHDGYDIMGNWGPHNYNAKHKAESGWIIESNGSLEKVNANGTFTLYPIQYEPNGRLLALQIPRVDGENLWVEYRGTRDNNSFDYDMPHWSHPPGTQQYNGVIFHIDDPVKNRSFIFNPLGILHNHPRSPALEEGQTFTDPLTGTTIETLDVYHDSTNPEDSYVTVEVTLGSALTCEGGLQPRECNGTGDAEFCFNGDLISTDCRGCGCEAGSSCGEESDGSYSCCASVNEDGECITCYQDSECWNGDNCTNDVCINQGTVDSYCQHTDVENSCGDKECGTDTYGCNECGECSAGSNCMGGYCSTSTCLEQDGFCMSKFRDCNSDPETSGYTEAYGLDYYCPQPDAKCCIQSTPDFD